MTETISPQPNTAEAKAIPATDFGKGHEFFKQILEASGNVLTADEQGRVIDGTVDFLAKMKTELQKPGAAPLTAEQLLGKIQTAVLANTLLVKSPGLMRWDSEGPIAYGISENRANIAHWNDLKPPTAESPEKPEDK